MRTNSPSDLLRRRDPARPTPGRDRGASPLLRTLLGLTALALASYACGDSATPPRVPGPGTLTARLTSLAGAESAARFRLIGDGVRDVTASAGRLFRATRGDTTDVIVVLETAGDVGFFLAVADTTDLPAISVLEVAGPDNALRALGGYSVVTAR